MAIETVICEDSYVADGTTTPRAIGFPLLSPDELIVEVAGVAQTLGYDYSITGDYANGSGLIAPIHAWANGARVDYYRVTLRVQRAIIPAGQPLPARSIERQLDRHTLIQQELAANVDRAVKLRRGDTSSVLLPTLADRAGKALGFDADGNGVPLTVGDGDDPSLRSDLAEPNGIGLVGGVPAAVREKVETLNFTLDEMANEETLAAIINRTGLTPQMTGALAGDANHSTAINTAIDRIITAGGGQLWLPPTAGDWKIGSALNMHKAGYTTSNLRMRGVGDKARLRWLNTTGDMIVIGNGVNPVYYVMLEDLYLYAGGGARTTGVDFNAKKANIVHLKNIVTDGSYGGIYLQDVNSVYGQMVHINMPNQTTGRGVWCYSDPAGSGRSDIIKFDELTCQAYNAGSYGIVVEGRVAGFHTDGAYMLGTRRGLQITSASSAFADIPQFCDFNKFETDRALEISVDIEKAYRTEFRRCEISNTSGALDSPYPQGSADNQAFYINSGAIDTKIIGGRIGNCREQAVYDNGRGTTIQGTSLTDMAKNTGADFGAIYAGPAADGFLYQDLLIDGYSRAKWATHIESTAKNGRINGVRYQNVVTAYAQGTGVNVTNTGQLQTSYTY